jgi:hypothetical protein
VKKERKSSGGTKVVLFGTWFVLVMMISLNVQPYAGNHPYLAWSMVIVGIAVFVVGIVFALGMMMQRGRPSDVSSYSV